MTEKLVEKLDINQLENELSKIFRIYRPLENALKVIEDIRGLDQYERTVRKKISEVENDLAEAEKKKETALSDIDEAKKRGNDIINKANSDAEVIKSQASSAASKLRKEAEEEKNEATLILSKAREDEKAIRQTIRTANSELSKVNADIQSSTKELNDLRAKKQKFLENLKEE